MKKMTMHQELDLLRKQVNDLEKEKKEYIALRQQEEEKSKQQNQKYIDEAEEKIEEIVSSIKEGEVEVEEVFTKLFDSLKDDYEKISPLSAIVLFALGAAFGHSIKK